MATDMKRFGDESWKLWRQLLKKIVWEKEQIVFAMYMSLRFA
jgi:hypothetical protein